MTQEQIIKLYQSGLTIKEVAQQLGRSETNIRRYLDLGGIQRRSQEIPLPVTDAELQLLYESGLTIKQLAIKFERSTAVIHRHVKQGTWKRGSRSGPRKATLRCQWCKQDFPRQEVLGAACIECRKILPRLKTLRKKYGITLAQFNAMVTEQQGKCLICERVPEDYLVVDHCHETKRVRGLLCSGCNCGLGFFKDSVEIMAKAINYMQNKA